MRNTATFILILFVLFSCQRNNTWECEGDCFNGKGIKKYRDGGIEKGTWKDGELSGKGYHFFGKTSPSAGDSYEGDFLNGYYHGFGKYIDASNDGIYIGEFKNGKMDGKGKLTFGPNSEYPNQYYDCEWKEGKRHGYGVKFWGESGKWTNTIYKGEWKNDKMEGFGTYEWTDGSLYEGEWKNGEQHGKGIYTLPNGEKLESVWKEGYCRELDIMLHGESGSAFVTLLDEIFEPSRLANQKFIDLTTIAIMENKKNDSYQINFKELIALHDTAKQKTESVILELEEVPEFDNKIEYKRDFINNVKLQYDLLKEFDLWFKLMQNGHESEKLEQSNDRIFEKLKEIKKSQNKFDRTKKKFDRKHIE